MQLSDCSQLLRARSISLYIMAERDLLFLQRYELLQKQAASFLLDDAALKWYTRGESNPNRRNRNPKFYPLNYGCLYYLCGLMMQK